MRSLVVLLAALALGGPADAAPSTPARAYLDHALDLMQAHSLHRHSLDWAFIRARALAAADDADTSADTWPAVRLALTLLGDRHSALITPGGAWPASANAIAAAAPTLPHGALLDGGLAYLWLPGHAGGSARADVEYADALQTLIYKLDGGGACGWIVDLRDNPGGNMWPMLAGLGALLGDGRVGAFRGADGGVTHWWTADGSAGVDDRVHASSTYAYEFAHAPPPVAVLTGPATASSGEAVAVAFRGRDAARSFGAPTYGVPTGNRGFRLADGALMFVTSSRFVDRAGTVYRGPIAPDQATAGDPLDAAMDWLEARAECR